jgi:hypothetical protein
MEAQGQLILSKVVMIQAFLASLKPDREQLLSDLSKHISDDMLAVIALVDYGQDQEKHLTALRYLRDTGKFVEPMHWYPCEVLELVRHSQPAGVTSVQYQWICAFACAALLRAREEPWNYGGGAASYTLIRLINSIETLPIAVTSQAIRMLAWVMSHSDLEGQDEEVIYCGVGLLWLALRLAAPPSDKDLIELSAWIVQRESEIHKVQTGAFDRWLLGIGNDPPPSPWESLGQKLSKLELGHHQRELQDWVKLIGSELSGDGMS